MLKFSKSGGFEETRGLKSESMKKISAPVTAFLFTVWLCAQKPFAKNKQALRQTLEKMFDALSDSDTAGLKLYLRVVVPI